MGYDEHFGGSPEAGSVSSYNFVKEGIEETLKEVPAEKVISGIPFFTRLWEETPKTEKELAKNAGTEAAEYTMKVSSDALGMSSAEAKVWRRPVQSLHGTRRQSRILPLGNPEELRIKSGLKMRSH